VASSPADRKYRATLDAIAGTLGGEYPGPLG
jgi:hypothetical protein